MSESRRNPYLLLIFGTEEFPHPLPKSFRASSQVDRNIKIFTLHNTDQFSLDLGGALVMQPSQYVVHTFRVVVLNEGDVLSNSLVEGFLIEAFEEKATVIAEMTLGSMIRTSGIRVGVTFISRKVEISNSIFYQSAIYPPPSAQSIA